MGMLKEADNYRKSVKKASPAANNRKFSFVFIGYGTNYK